MPLKVKKNKKPKTPKVTIKESKSKGKHSQKQSITVNIHKQKRNTGLEKAVQQAKHPQPNFQLMSGLHSPSQNDSSLLFRELFANKLRNHPISSFERAVASQAVDQDRMLEAERLRMAESNPLRRVILAPKSPAEKYGLDVGTIPQPIGERIPIQNQGTMGFTEDKRLTESEYLAQRRPPHEISKEFLREQRLFNLKKPPNTLTRLIETAEHDGHTVGDPHPIANTLEEVIRQAATDPTSREQLQFFSDLGDNGEQEMEAPDRKRDTEATIGEPVPPVRLHAYLKQHGTAGDIERYARGEAGGSLYEQGEDLAEEEELEAGAPLPHFKEDEGAIFLNRAELGQGEGMLGEEAVRDRQETAILRGRGRGKLPRPEIVEPRSNKGRKPKSNDPKAVYHREANAASRARKKLEKTALAEAVYGRGLGLGGEY